MPHGNRGHALARTLRICRIITCRWMTVRDIAKEVDLEIKGSNDKNRKRIERDLKIIELAGYPLQVDIDESEPTLGRPKLYYRLPKNWINF